MTFQEWITEGPRASRPELAEWMRNDADEIISLVPDMGQAYDGLDRGR